MNLKKSRQGNIKVLERGNGKEKCNFIIITKTKFCSMLKNGKWFFNNISITDNYFEKYSLRKFLKHSLRIPTAKEGKQLRSHFLFYGN